MTNVLLPICSGSPTVWLSLSKSETVVRGVGDGTSTLSDLALAFAFALALGLALALAWAFSALTCAFVISVLF